MSKTINYIPSIFILFFLTLQVSGQTRVWSEVAPGVWKMSVGLPEKLNLKKETGGINLSRLYRVK